ncbi:phage head-tail connector protein [Rhizobium sp. NTR19]|uniref:Phage head-tail connector protein n=1 Tax=Neorhizobium turbinariae TaxID=2937795 RepID=A0ABT0IMK4_9HYPH|nr:phage head-tail connector protein [Neorhizobium turbinariae]MCK8779081.1 phage head-tail connector protein [Neorhizobium turbinariae]
MFRPVRVTPSADLDLPISVEDVKTALRVDGDDTDGEIERLIKAAVQHYEGWSGVLGIAIVEQTWRQDYGRFEEKMGLKVGPVTSIASVKYRNDQGQIATVAADKYALKHTGGGEAYVRFDRGFTAPVDLYEDAPISIEYVAGWPIGEVPADIQTAIILRVQKHFDAAAQTNSDVLDRVEKDLTSRYLTLSI